MAAKATQWYPIAGCPPAAGKRRPNLDIMCTSAKCEGDCHKVHVILNEDMSMFRPLTALKPCACAMKCGTPVPSLVWEGLTLCTEDLAMNAALQCPHVAHVQCVQEATRALEQGSKLLCATCKQLWLSIPIGMERITPESRVGLVAARAKKIRDAAAQAARESKTTEKRAMQTKCPSYCCTQHSAHVLQPTNYLDCPYIHPSVDETTIKAFLAVLPEAASVTADERVLSAARSKNVPSKSHPSIPWSVWLGLPSPAALTASPALREFWRSQLTSWCDRWGPVDTWVSDDTETAKLLTIVSRLEAATAPAA